MNRHPLASRASGRRQNGAAVILAILVVAVVTTLAAAMVADYGQAVEHVSGRHDQAQARWLARGAIDWARNVLEDDARRPSTREADYLKLPELWYVPVPPTPVEEGEVSGEIKDLSGRFNVNSLIAENGQLSPPQQEVFLRLLGHLDFSRAQAEALCADLIEWLDADDAPVARGSAESAWYRSNKRRPPPQAAIVDLQELAAVRGFTDEVLSRVLPHVSALPPGEQRINLNTTTAEVLAAHIDRMSLAQARTVLADRERAPFLNRRDAEARLPAGLGLAAELDVKSYYFLATGRASWGDAMTRMEVMLVRNAQRPSILWQKIL